MLLQRHVERVLINILLIVAHIYIYIYILYIYRVFHDFRA